MNDDIIDKLSSENARLIALYKIVLKEDIFDITILDKLLKKLEKADRYYLASKISSRIAGFYKKRYDEEFINSETTQSELKHLKKHRKNAMLNFKKQLVYIEKSVASLKKEYLHVKVAHSLKQEAEKLFLIAKKLEEQAKLLKGKSISLKLSYSKYAARFNKKKSLINLKESYYFKECALKLLGFSINSFKLALMSGDVLQTRKIFHEYYANYLAGKKGASAALKYSLKSRCYNLASIYAEKTGDHQLSKSFKEEYDISLTQMKNQAYELESKAKAFDKQGRIEQKKIVELEDKVKNLKTKNIVVKIFLNFFYFFKLKIDIIKKRKSILSSEDFYNQAKLAFLDSELFGKAAEIERKKDNLIKNYENVVKATEDAIILGEVSDIYKVNATFSSLIAFCQQSKNKVLLTHIRRKAKELAFVIKRTHAADRLEIASDNDGKQNKKDDLIYKAMLIYEDIGFFPLAKELALKIKDTDKLRAYQKIV